MSKFIKAISLILVFAITAVAQTQIATVISDSPFVLRGAQVAAGEGVPAWPALPGDVIKTGTSNVTITFPDGTTIVLAPDSEGKLEMVNGKPVFTLQKGAMHYALKTADSVKLIAGTHTVSPVDLVGEAKLGSSNLAKGWWTTGHTVAAVGAAGGATALGVGFARRNPSGNNNNQGGNNNNQGGNNQN